MGWASIANYLAANWLEIAGTVTTVVGIWLTTRRLLICWPVVLAADLIYLVVFYRAELLSDALLQVFFVIFTMYGWWNWWQGVREEGEVRVARLGTSSLLFGIAAGAVGSIVLGELAKHIQALLGTVASAVGSTALAEFAKHAHATLPFLDATLASYSLVASWWQARKHTANWWLWIGVDVVYIGEYIYKNLWPTGLLYAGLVGLAVLGLRDWRQAEANAV